MARPAPPPSALAARARAWAAILSAYFTAQTLTQLLGIAAGLVFINFMPVGEYALYTLATSVVTFFIFATDLGSSTSLLYFYRQAASAGEDFARYFAAVLSLRRAAFALGVVAVLAVVPRLAAAKGFAPAAVLLACAGVVVGVWFQITSTMRLLDLRLADRYGQSYRAEVAGAALRLVLALLLVALALVRAWLAILVSAAGTALVAALARRPRAAAANAVTPAELGPHRRRVLRYLLPTLPSAAYFAVQGPLVVWLAATFGGTRNIAEVGALGRLGLVVGIFSSLTGVVFLPRLARVADDRLYRRRYFLFGGLMAAVAAAMLLAAWLFPQAFLALLGGNYAGLRRELLLVVAGAGLTLLGGYAVAVNLARSWTRLQTVAVAALAATQATLVFVLTLSTTAGVLLFNLWSAAVGCALQVAIAVLGFWRPRLVQWS